MPWRRVGADLDHAAREAADLPRCGARGGEDLRHARRGTAPEQARHRRGHRLRRDPRPGPDRASSTGLEVVPRRTLDYRGATFAEMDLDAVLARRPAGRAGGRARPHQIPGARNDKRWQDVEELLAAGIDVISTLNIQHLKSLNDVVETITGVQQRETIPDEVVRRADQVELVDMTPEALRRRMAHGNIYAPEKIDAALSHYFRPGNLTALRELALLWVADRVDEALQRYRDEHGITGPGRPGSGWSWPSPAARRARR